VAIILIPVLVIVASSIIVKTGAVALQMTGLDSRTASFQALSAFTNAGFTTREAESVVNHRTRRRIIRALMILGNAGLASSIVGLVLSFRGSFDLAAALKLVILVAVAFTLYSLAIAKRFNRFLDRFIQKRLSGYSTLNIVEFEELLQVSGHVGLSALSVAADSEMAGRSLAELGLGSKHVLVLSIDRQGRIIAEPTAATVVQEGDRLICYGRMDVMRDTAAAQTAPQKRQ